MIKVRTKELRRCDVVYVEGKVETSTAPILDHELKRLTRKGRYNVVVDFSEAWSITSAGLRVLLEAREKRGRRGKVKLVIISEKVRAPFLAGGFDTVFSIFDTTVDAVGSF